MEWYVKVLRQYVNFEGRARRRELWMFALFNGIFSVILAVIDNVLGLTVGRFGILGLIYGIGVLLPALGVDVRRLHDTDRSGWWILIGLIPIIGAIVLIVFFVQDSQPGPNQHGPNPKEPEGHGSAPAY